MKGATNLKGYGFPPKYDFNPRTREGCDLRLRKRWEMIRDDFNPRTREGCDQTSDRFLKIESIISIHAPVKGATSDKSCIHVFDMNFNPRTREGCDLTLAIPGIPSTNFNPRTREGCDERADSDNVRATVHFNPRTREGCDIASPPTD